jgi:S1-C subfamily serine protease
MKKINTFLTLVFTAFLGTALFFVLMRGKTFDNSLQEYEIINTGMNRVYYTTNLNIAGSCFLFDKGKGIFITAGHVAEKFVLGKTFLFSVNGKKIEIVDAQSSDEVGDVGLLYVKPKDLDDSFKEIKISSAVVIPGQKIYSFGFPFGDLRNSFCSQGYLGTTSEVLLGTNRKCLMLRLDLSIVGGMSGGPILNSRGKLVGLNSCKMDGVGMTPRLKDIIFAIKTLQVKYERKMQTINFGISNK